ncbi:MAG: hypothetical protein COB76_03650 [Alphaproteobacteria bacterium]|nr:MAG: hypothetical protein COB76_03650 [Alphaproteobacteria bacterium]
MSKILIFQQRGWGVRIGHPIATQLNRDGHAIAAITAKKTTARFIQEQSDLNYFGILNHDEIIEFPEKVLEKFDVIPSLQKICDDLGVDSIWPIANRLRTHARSYKDKYYYSFRQNMNDKDIIIYIQALYLSLKSFLDEVKPDIILTPNFASVIQEITRLLAKKKSIPMVGVMYTKVDGRFSFIGSGFCDQGYFIDRYNDYSYDATSDEIKTKTVNFLEEQESATNKVNNIRPPKVRKTCVRRFKDIILPFYLCFRFYWRRSESRENRRANLGPTLDYRPPYYILRDHFMHLWNKRNAWQYPYSDIEKIKSPYAFFPLQFQPEEQIDVISGYFNNQIEIARLTAQSLPGDMTLVVKEHPSMIGRRSRSFYDKIARSPNVKLVAPDIDSQRAIHGAQIVLAPSGTVLMEAALMKIPAIQFGEMGITKLLPNITYHTDFPSLPKKIVEVLSSPFDDKKYDQSMRRYVACSYEHGFLMEYVKVWEKGGEGDEIDYLYRQYKDVISYYLNKKVA